MKTQESLTKKLLDVKVSGMFTAMLDAILDVKPRRTSPALQSLCITSDGYVLGMAIGDIGFNEFLADSADLKRNCEGVAEVAKLTKAELTLFRAKVASLSGPA